VFPEDFALGIIPGAELDHFVDPAASHVVTVAALKGFIDVRAH
jgi:hypothetical protein